MLQGQSKLDSVRSFRLCTEKHRCPWVPFNILAEHDINPAKQTIIYHNQVSSKQNQSAACDKRLKTFEKSRTILHEKTCKTRSAGRPLNRKPRQFLFPSAQPTTLFFLQLLRTKHFSWHKHVLPKESERQL